VLISSTYQQEIKWFTSWSLDTRVQIVLHKNNENIFSFKKHFFLDHKKRLNYSYYRSYISVFDVLQLVSKGVDL